jgi:hypothetical protein
VSLRDQIDRGENIEKLATAIDNGQLVSRDRFQRLRPANVRQVEVSLTALALYLTMKAEPEPIDSRDWHFYWREWHEEPIPGLTDSGFYLDGDAIVSPASDASASSLTASRSKPVPRFKCQDDDILRAIRTFDVDPLALPRNTPGKSGIKAKVKRALGTKEHWAYKTVFKKAWDRLLKRGDIAYRDLP